MTEKNQQIYNDFQLVYNNLASNAAAGLDIYEISMYLTKAYYAFVESMYSDYEKKESVRKALIELVTTNNIPPTSGMNTKKICKDSTFFKLPDDVLFIVYEGLQMGDNAGKCIKGKTLPIIPVTHDDFHNVYRNPFKFTETNALRLDVDFNNERYSEIVSKDNHIKNYFIRYVRKPKPIILENLEGTDNIDGYTNEMECELNTIYYKDIVRVAAQLAYSDYKS